MRADVVAALRRHHSSPAQPGPPNDPPKVPPRKPPPPRWRHLLWLGGLAITFLLLFLLPTGPRESTKSLTYTDWRVRVAADKVKTADIDPSGDVTGELTDKSRYSSRIPMVREYGMSERLGPVGFASDSPVYLGGEEVRSRAYAEGTQRVIDEEVAALLRQAEHQALALLTSRRDALDRLTADLLAHETVDGDAVRAALAEPPAPPVSDEPAFERQLQAGRSTP